MKKQTIKLAKPKRILVKYSTYRSRFRHTLTGDFRHFTFATLDIKVLLF